MGWVGNVGLGMKVLIFGSGNAKGKITFWATICGIPIRSCHSYRLILHWRCATLIMTPLKVITDDGVLF